MDEHDWLAEQFEEHRGHLRAVAYRMLGSLSEADDAVQESWLRLSRSDTSDVENLRGWLTTVVARVCLNVLRSRRTRREEPLDVRVPDPVVSRDDGTQPEHEALLADSVGLALLVVLETLGPAERLAFVLHDMFAVPFDEIAGLVGPLAGRDPAARQPRAAPRPGRRPGARRRPRRSATRSSTPSSPPRATATSTRSSRCSIRTSCSRADGGVRPGASAVVRGAREVAARALTFARLAPFVRPALVNGAAGVVVAPHGEPFSVMGFTVVGGRIVEIDAITDPERLRALDLAVLDD